MASMLMEIDVEMEGGDTYQVVADQRDMAKWEVQPFGCSFNEFESRGMTAIRFLAWSALSRQQKITMKWDEFNAQCIEAMASGDDEDTDADNPGQTVPSA